MIEFNFILNFLDLVFLQGDLFGIREGPLGTDDPIVKGMLPSAFAVIGFSASSKGLYVKHLSKFFLGKKKLRDF